MNNQLKSKRKDIRILEVEDGASRTRKVPVNFFILCFVFLMAAMAFVVEYRTPILDMLPLGTRIKIAAKVGPILEMFDMELAYSGNEMNVGDPTNPTLNANTGWGKVKENVATAVKAKLQHEQAAQGKSVATATNANTAVSNSGTATSVPSVTGTQHMFQGKKWVQIRGKYYEHNSENRYLINGETVYFVSSGTTTPPPSANRSPTGE
jgi:hypothetical protein